MRPAWYKSAPAETRPLEEKAITAPDGWFRADETAAGAFRNVLVAVDGSEAAARALTRAIEIADASRGRLGILAPVPPVRMCLGLSPVTVSAAGVAQDLEATAKRHVEQAVAAVPADIPVTKLVIRGTLTDAVARQASRGTWDLAVVSHGSWPSGRFVLRVLAVRLRRSCPIPFVIVGRAQSDRTLPESAEGPPLANGCAPQPV